MPEYQQREVCQAVTTNAHTKPAFRAATAKQDVTWAIEMAHHA